MDETLLGLTTELEAVNAMLASVGESPLVSLEDAFIDGESAFGLLKQEIRRAQLYEWSFNEETDVILTPDTDGAIILPINTLRVTPLENPEIVLRGRKLYDKTAHSDVFPSTASYTVQMRVALNFEELPEALRQFATIRAGRRFQDNYAADAVQHKFQKEDELAAWATALNDDAAANPRNMLDKSPLNLRMKRGRPLG